jgi:hypothetical protein
MKEVVERHVAGRKERHDEADYFPLGRGKMVKLDVAVMTGRGDRGGRRISLLEACFEITETY